MSGGFGRDPGEGESPGITAQGVVEMADEKRKGKMLRREFIERSASGALGLAVGAQVLALSDGAQGEISMEKQEDWRNVLKADPTDWLLQQAEDLDRYYILREIMEKPEDDAEVSSLRKTLVDEILGEQLENGSWNDMVYDYEKGTTHQLMKLIELGLSIQDEPIKKGAEYMLRFQVENGSFVQKQLGCGVEANLVATNAVVLALARTGYADDPRVAKAYEWLCSWQQEDGSWLSPRAKKSREEGEGYPHPYCGFHATCNVLLGLSATERTRKSEAAKRGANFILSLYGHKYDRSDEPPYAMSGKPFSGAWFDPRCMPPEAGIKSDKGIEMVSTIHVLSTLSILGYGLENEKVDKGLRRLIEFQAEDGRWAFQKPEMTYWFTLVTLMTIKSLHQPLSVFSFHGH
jgi:hypothetical protein